MPRIPDEVLEKLKHEIALPSLAERTGLELKKTGHELTGRCPFHEDSTPSLSINPERNVFQCFGCGAAGTPVDWTMKEKGLDFRQAVELLLRDFYPSDADALLGGERAARQRPRVELPCPFEPEAEGQELLDQYAALCHAILKESPVAHDYLRKRGLDDAELVSRFALGYADRSLGLRLPIMQSKAGREIRLRLQKLGILRESGHEHLVGSLVIPIRDEDRRVRNLYGRKTRNDLRPGTPDHLYLPGPHRGVFNVEALKASSEVILCESLIDALTFWRWGFRNVTAAYGVGNFTDEILGAMKLHRTERVLIAFDRDDAGDAGARKVAEKLLAAGVECFRVLFPKGMDANEVALKMTPAEKTLALFLRSAEWMGKGPRPPHAEIAYHAPEASSSAARAASPVATPSPVATAPLQAEACGVVDAASDHVATEKEETRASEKEGSEPTPPSGLVSLTDNEALFTFDDRRYRIRDLKKGLAHGSLRLTIRAEREGDYFAPPSPISGWFLDTVDLCLSRQRALFEKNAAHEMSVKDEVVRFDLGKVVRALEELQDRRIAEALAPKSKTPAMSESEHEEALAFAKDPRLLERIVESFSSAGIVGEATNALVLYLAAISRKLDRPLAVVIRSSSAAGKTALMDAVLGFVPDEEQERYSALTENVLFYFEGKSFEHKILAIAEEQGAQRASYPLKLLQSEGVVKAASTGKDPATGRLDAKEYEVRGPLMILLSSTAADMDEEFLNRSLVLTVDESREQTKRIHELQREGETLEGFLQKSERKKLQSLHKNFQRLLRPLAVFNPFSRGLTFLDDQTRTRRDHPKYLTLIRSIALLQQHQREIKTCLDAEGKSVEYIEVTREDLVLANRLASEVLGHTLSELQPQTKKLLLLLHEWVSEQCERSGVLRQDFLFTRRQTRDALRWGDTQLKIHLSRLVELEYLLLHRGGRGQSFVYELLYEGQGKEGERFLLGLADTETLAYDRNRSGFSDERSAPGRAAVGGRSAGGWDEETTVSTNADGPSGDFEPETTENAQLPLVPGIAASYPRNGHKHVNGHAGPRLNLLRFPPSSSKPTRRAKALALELTPAAP
jgi:DNA primase